MQPKSLKLVAFSLIGLSVILAIVGIRLGSSDNNKAVTLAPESPYKVLVSTRDIEPNSILTDEDVQTIPYPLSTGGTFQKAKDVVGKEIFVRLPKGEVLRQSHFEISSVLAEQVTPGHRAMAVSVDETVGAGGFLMPGDSVDVIFAAKGGSRKDSSHFSRRILSDIKVLAFGNVIQGSGPDGEPVSGKRSRTAVLEVPEPEISKLLLADTSGTLRLAAVGDRELAQLKLEAEPTARIEVKADMSDIVGKPKSTYVPPKVYVYHGDTVETVRTSR